MNLLVEIQNRFKAALSGMVEDPGSLLEMIRRSSDARFGDYQANCAMPLKGILNRPPKEIAEEIVSRLKIDDLCEEPEIAGPGFINLRLRDDFLASLLEQAVEDPRLGCAPQSPPRTYVIDYSGPNVAKPMHVGHIRSTVIGDSLCRVLRFLGHQVIGDNHIGDWGTQFGMIIYGVKHFPDQAAGEPEVFRRYGQLYRLVNQLVEYHRGAAELPTLGHTVEELRQELAGAEAAIQAAGDNAKEINKAQSERKRALRRLEETQEELAALENKQAAVESNPQLALLAQQHPHIAAEVLAETAKLHSGDPENRQLWEQILPPSLAVLEKTYQRLGIKFDCTLGESFYHDRLDAVVRSLTEAGTATESDGAIVVFLEGYDTPMIIRKRDGAFLYATTDLATVQYRMDEWQPSAMLYVVDHRQSLHFEQLFAVARRWGYPHVEMKHVEFGTILGDDGRPFKTRTGGSVGLGEVLDEAVAHARQVVAENDKDQQFSEEQRDEIAEIVGLGAIKYADLSHNRSSDYKFSYEKMMATTGNTATYMQYAYARVRSIFRKGKVDIEALRASGANIWLDHPAERALALEIARFPEAVAEVVVEYRPNLLTSYLFDQLAKSYSTFYEKCPVIKAENEAVRHSRLLLADLTARTLAKGLELLGINVVEKL